MYLLLSSLSLSSLMKQALLYCKKTNKQGRRPPKKVLHDPTDLWCKPCSQLFLHRMNYEVDSDDTDKIH